jgi:tetratricopeptide (TPR) repeat protein
MVLYEALGDRNGQALIHLALGEVHRLHNRHAQALDNFNQSLSLFQHVGNKRMEGQILGHLGILHKMLGEYSDAIECFNEAILIHRALGDRRKEGFEIGNLGDALLEQGAFEEAAEQLTTAISIGEETMPLTAGAFRGSLALIRARQGDIEQAHELLSVVEPLVEPVPVEYGKFLWQTRTGLTHRSRPGGRRCVLWNTHSALPRNSMLPLKVSWAPPSANS